MGHFAGKDIVARLRGAEPCIDGRPCRAMEARSGCCCAEAADTIERLRMALVEITDRSLSESERIGVAITALGWGDVQQGAAETKPCNMGYVRHPGVPCGLCKSMPNEDCRARAIHK